MGGFSCSKYLEPEHDTRCNNLYQESSHMFTYVDQNKLMDMLIASGKLFIEKKKGRILRRSG